MKKLAVTIMLKDLFSAALKTVATAVEVFTGKSKKLESQMKAEVSAIKERTRQVETALQEQMDAEDAAVRAVGKAAEEYEAILEKERSALSGKVKEYDSIRSASSQAASAVRSLNSAIGSLKSKTITITTIYVYKTRGSKGSNPYEGSSKGSNPYSSSAPTTGPGLSSTTDAADAKDIVEKTVLPALKTLAREGKVSEEVVLQ